MRPRRWLGAQCPGHVPWGVCRAARGRPRALPRVGRLTVPPHEERRQLVWKASRVRNVGRGGCARLSLSLGSERDGRSSRVRRAAQSQPPQPQATGGGELWRPQEGAFSLLAPPRGGGTRPLAGRLRLSRQSCAARRRSRAASARRRAARRVYRPRARLTCSGASPPPAGPARLRRQAPGWSSAGPGRSGRLRG